jgi:hypothetical protein
MLLKYKNPSLRINMRTFDTIERIDRTDQRICELEAGKEIDP